jgi:Protein of unknown function (DUF3089)
MRRQGRRPVNREGPGARPATRKSLPLVLGTLALLGPPVLVGVSAVPSAAATGATAAAAVSKTVWLCRPGQADDPCTSNLSSTTVTASGSAQKEAASAATSSKFDCFYVYPTVSPQATANANLEVQGEETVTAQDQASRFSQVCRVWAPMYRQRTVASLAKNQPGANQVAYESVLAGWKDYLAHDNHGRPIVFIGHSQGAAMLIRLLQNEIDPNPRLRKLMVSAIILGGNVTVPVGKDVGGSFRHIPLCRAATETGCVIAYSSFGAAPPANTLFGRPGTGVSSLSGQTASSGLQVACVNPVTFSSASGPLLPYFLSGGYPVPGVDVSTPWVSFPGLYTARCETLGGATTLQVAPTGVPGDPRPRVTASLGPAWGYHLSDVNLSLGNLVADVAREEGSEHR